MNDTAVALGVLFFPLILFAVFVACSSLTACAFGHHDDVTIVDCDARRSFQRCRECKREFQYPFQAEIGADWIGFIDKAHTCPKCLGWRPRDARYCGGLVCSLNPPNRVLSGWRRSSFRIQGQS